MKKYGLLIFTFSLLFVLAACGNNNDENNEEMAMVEVDYQLPETAEVGEEVELIAVVTFEDEPVEDAKELDFEVWEKGDRDNGDMLEAEHVGDGKYVATYTFDRDGIFESYAHTTARDMHVMPKKEITIGEGGDYDDVDEEDDEDHDDHHNHE
ncbi:MAG TPA: FixH family protein [Pseudogracilibacillus sp.]|nr:FixH family protein [Pseudogracilibacillus sp.]